MFRNSCIWISVLLLVLSIIVYFVEINIFGSEYIAFYSLSILGLLSNLIGRRLRFERESTLTIIMNKIGFFGSLLMVIIFFPPFYMIWGTLILVP